MRSVNLIIFENLDAQVSIGPDNTIQYTPDEFLSGIWRLYPKGLLYAMGEPVGLSHQEMPSAETGFFCLGSGRTIYESSSKINLAIANGTFYKHPIIINILEYLKDNPEKKIHLIGNFDNPVLCNIEHVLAILFSLKQREIKNVYVYLTEEKNSGTATNKIRQINVGKILDAQNLNKSVAEGDIIFFADFRGDLSRQLFSFYSRCQDPANIKVYSLTQYDRAADQNYLFPPENVIMPLSRVISLKALRQINLATNAAATKMGYYFNGAREIAFEGQEKKYCTKDTLFENVMRNIYLKKYNFIAAAISETDFYSPEEKRAFLGSIIKSHDNDQSFSIITASNSKSGFVPFILINKTLTSEKIRLNNGSLIDVSPSILSLMQILKPESMTGKSLVEEVHV